VTLARRRLGGTGLSVAPIAFGGNVLGWTADEPRSFALLDAFVDAGFNLIDTADVYSSWVDGHRGGESETILGRWLADRGRRDDVVLASTVGMEMGDGGRGLSPAHIRRSIRGSLERLGTDRIDLYQAHQDDPGTPLGDTLAAFGELLEEGSVGAIGASNYAAPRLEAALAAAAEAGLPPYRTLQTRYNLATREEFEPALEPLAARTGLGVLAFPSLAGGFLTGKYRSPADFGRSPRGARMSRYLDERGLRILSALDAVAKAQDAPLAAVAVAWLLARPTVTVAIASATTLSQLQEVLHGAELSLRPEEILELDRASA
jgi:aryl-alcohol dehydrogenase-like predicted oxidoreductase